MSGIKAAVRSKNARKAPKGDDWDLDMEGGGVEYLANRDELPVLVTLNLVPGSTAFFLDATPQEESTCLDRLHLFFNASGKVCGIRTEGTEGLDATRVRGLLQVSFGRVGSREAWSKIGLGEGARGLCEGWAEVGVSDLSLD